jgi:hypothetical protein
LADGFGQPCEDRVDEEERDRAEDDRDDKTNQDAAAQLFEMMGEGDGGVVLDQNSGRPLLQRLHQRNEQVLRLAGRQR